MQLTKHFYYFIIALILFSTKALAENDTIYFDKNWKNTIKESALYYRIKPIKIKTKKAIGYKIAQIDSVYLLNDYYLKNHKLQFQGFSEDKEGKHLVGQSKWYDEDENLIQSTDYNYKLNNSNSRFRIPKWPIIYVGYSIATKSQFTGGLEFCLDCKDKNKLFLGLGYGITSYDGKYYGLPDLHLSYNLKEYLFIKTGASDKNAYALAGITFLNMIDLGFGYSAPFNKEKVPVIKGFTFGITFRISKNNDAYGKLKMM